jgi:NAD(P)H-hydrate epimerase
LLLDPVPFQSEEGIRVPAVTEEQMREVDRVAMQEFGLGVLQMMENAGRILALHVLDMLSGRDGPVVILAGPGGNGGGGICCARHLHNSGLDLRLALSRPPERLGESAARQYRILSRAGIRPLDAEEIEEAIRGADVIVDALIGYSLRGEPRGVTAEMIELCNKHCRRVLSLDLPSGLDATSGESPGLSVHAERTLTLALPKTGLARYAGDLFLADIGIPPEVFHGIGIRFEPFFAMREWIRLTHVDAMTIHGKGLESGI